MTESPRVPPLKFANIDDVVSAIRENGGRLTAARRLVLDALFDADGPVSAELIASRLARRGPELELTSVYRSLERLESLGVVRHVHLGHGPGLYSLVAGGDREYLACERCNRVMSVEPARLDAVRDEIRKRFGYEARFTHFPITGLCPDCAVRAAGGVDHQQEHSEHEHEHSHGDRVHSHPHVHQKDLGDGHEHAD